MLNWIYRNADEIILNKLGQPFLSFRCKKIIIDIRKMELMLEKYDSKMPSTNIGSIQKEDMMQRIIMKLYKLSGRAATLGMDKKYLIEKFSDPSVIEIIENSYKHKGEKSRFNNT